MNLLKKLSLIALTGISTITISYGQQWSGNANTTSTINRSGTVQLRTTTGNNYLELKTNSIKLADKYASQYIGPFVTLDRNSLFLGIATPTSSSMSKIERGAFEYRYVNTSTGSTFKYYNGQLSMANSFWGPRPGLSAEAYLGFNAESNGTSFNFKSNNGKNGGVIAYGTSNGDFVVSCTSSTGSSSRNITSTDISNNATLRVTPNTVYAKEIQVQTSVWADYVFDDDYNLRSLDDVEKFITENNHLPEVPSEADVMANGINVAEMNAVMLKKVEELTLYMIELKNENKAIKAEINSLK